MANSGNGGIIGVSNVVVNGCAACATASGVWELNTVYDYVKDSDWVYNFASLDYLVIAGGGSSGNVASAGGGAGGMLSSFPGGTKVDLREGSSTTVTVGLGGAVVSCGAKNGVQGVDSTLATITSTGGGYGSSENSGAGGPGGSGGGNGSGGPATGSGTPGQGNPGGNKSGSSAGGGGGAGAAGSGNNGSAGLANLIAPAYPLGTTFAGGGGGHGQPGAGGSAGPGGGGAGKGYGGGTSTVGTDGLGGGAGGGNPGCSMAAGDGVIFVRMPTACKPAAYAVAPGTNTTATVGSCTIATFTVTGTLTL